MSTKAAVSFLKGFLVPLLVAYMALGFVVRLGLWIAFRADSRVHFTGFLSAVGMGAVNDIVEFLYLAVPLSLILTLTRKGFLSRRGGSIFLGIVSYVVLFICLFPALAEVLFWEEFESRFNLIAVDYLIYPTEVVGNIRESYPVVALIGGVMLIAGAIWFPVYRSIRSRLARVEVPLVHWYTLFTGTP